MKILCRSDELAEGEALGVEHEQPGERGYVVLRRDGKLHAYINRCPHTGVNLEWLPNQFLDSSGDFIQCAVHGAIFDIKTGQCLRGPCAGDALMAIAVEEHDGNIILAG